MPLVKNNNDKNNGVIVIIGDEKTGNSNELVDIQL